MCRVEERWLHLRGTLGQSLGGGENLVGLGGTDNDLNLFTV
jgi:hypothetical protein